MKHKKITIIIIMLTILALPVFSNFRAHAATEDDYLKIGLKYGSASIKSCTLKSEDGFILGTVENRSFDEGKPLPAYDEIVVANESGNVVIRDPDGTLLSTDLGSSGCIMPGDYSEDGILYYDGTPYRGGIMLLSKSDGTMTVINYITLEHYIYGVLNSELGYSNPEEALKAQAVAARSFAELNIGKHTSDGFDLCTGTHCQVYKGYSGEYEATNAATDDTKGELIYYDGEPVTAFYFKNSGGHTQNSEDVWSGTLGYLRSVKDEYSPSYPWSTSLSFDSIQTKLEAAGFSPGEIESVAINQRNDTGAVSELKIIGSGATVYLKKEKIRSVLGATIVKSNVFELGGSDSGTSDGNWRISNGSSVINADSDLYVINGDGDIDKLDEDSSYGTNGSTTIKLGSSVASSEIVTSGTVYFNGYGYGHGVGMPQDSAIEMAKQGFDYEEILEYYFTDIEIK